MKAGTMPYESLYPSTYKKKYVKGTVTEHSHEYEEHKKTFAAIDTERAVTAEVLAGDIEMAPNIITFLKLTPPDWTAESHTAAISLVETIEADDRKYLQERLDLVAGIDSHWTSIDTEIDKY